MTQKNKKISRKQTEQERLLWYFERMDQVNRAMQSTHDLEQMMKDVLDTLLGVFECDRAWLVYPCDPDAATWQVPMERTRSEYPGVLPIGVELPLDPVGADVYRILRNVSGPVIFGLQGEHLVPDVIAKAFQVQSFIAMALYPKIGKPWSFGLHQCSHARIWTPDEERLFQDIGRRLSDTLTVLLAYRTLQESEEQIKQLIDTSPLAMVISSGIEERVDTVNNKFVELFGYTIEDMPDVAHWWPLAYPDEKYREEIKTQWHARVEQAIQNRGQIEPMEATVTCKDGSRRYVEFRLSSVGQKHLVTFVDLSERKQFEDALRERERHSQSLLRLSRKLEQAQTYSEVLNAAQDEVRDIIGYQNLWAYLFTPDKKQAKALFAKGPMSDRVMSENGTATINIQGDRMMEEFLETTEIMVVEDAQIDERTDKKIAARMGNRTLVHVPIVLFDRHMGSVGMGTFGDEGVLVPTASEREYLIALASHMAVTLDRIHLLDKRKQVEEALRESEERYRLLVTLSPDGIAIHSEGRILFVNPAMMGMSGVTSADQMVGKSVLDFIHPDFQELVQKRLHEIQITGQPISFIEEKLLRIDGSSFDVELAAVPYSFKDTQYIQIVARDITERKRADAQLLASEQLFRALVENSPDFIARYDREFRRIYVNPAIQKLFGSRLEDVLGKKPSEQSPVYAPQVYMDYLKQVIETGKESTTEMPYRTTEGEMHWGHMRFVPEFGPDGKVDSVLAIGRDIHEIKENERRFRMLAENFPDFVIRFDRDGRYLYVNPAFEKALGVPAESILGKTLQELPQHIKTEQNEARLALIQRAFDEEIACESTVRWDTETGERIFDDRYVPEKDATGNVVTVLCIARDVTEQKRAEEELQKTNDLLRAIIEAAPTAIIGLDLEGKVRNVWNPAAEKMLGWSVQEAMGRFLPSVPIEKEEEFQRFREWIRSGKTLNGIEVQRRRRDGTPIDYSIYASPLHGPKGQVIGNLAVLVDITERKRSEQALRESEERYRQLVNLSPDSIAVYSHAGVVFANPAAVRMAGAKSEEDLIGRSVLDFVHPDFRAVIKERMDEVQSTREPIPFVEEVFLRLDGSTIDVEVAVVPYSVHGVQYTQIVARDITERKHHELEREAIITVSNAMRKATTRVEILTVILDQLVELFDADGSMIALPNLENRAVLVEMGRGAVGERFTGLNLPQGKGVSGWVIANKKPYLNNQADTDPLFYRPDLLGDSACVASVPLIAQEKVIGALWIARHTNILEQELRLLNAIADIAANAIHRVMLHEQTVQQLHHLIALHQIDLAISANFDLRVTLDLILKNVKDELEVDAASILLIDPVTHTLDYAAGLGFRTRGIEDSHVRLGHGYAGRAAQEYRTISGPDLNLAPGTFSRLSLLADEGFVSHYATPLVVKGQVKGVLEIFHRKALESEREWIDYFETLATQAAIAIENASLFENLQRSNLDLMLAYDATIEGWSRALDLRDRETEGHTQRVTEMVLKLAEKMGMSDVEKMDLRRGALLHDIGKMGVPDSILLKSGTLSESEWKIMQQHPLYAYQMLSPIPYPKHALDIPYCHHEKWDGSGYPRGLKAEEIPLSARMFAVVDVFDALTSDRPYRAAWPREKVHRYIQEQAGIQFDPQIVKIFLEEN